MTNKTNDNIHNYLGHLINCCENDLSDCNFESGNSETVANGIKMTYDGYNENLHHESLKIEVGLDDDQKNFSFYTEYEYYDTEAEENDEIYEEIYDEKNIKSQKII